MYFIKCTHLFQVHLNALAMQLILAFMLCVVWSGTRKMILFHDQWLLQLKHQSERPLCNKRKLVIETVNGEIYGSSC
jgi:hypothetical protein